MDGKKRKSENSSRNKEDEVERVEIRLMILKIGSIKTQDEQFTVQLAMEARWLANESLLSTLDDDAQHTLSQGQILHLPDDFTDKKENWHPKLFLLNSSIAKEDKHIRYSLKKEEDEDDQFSSQIYAREHWIVEGSFNTLFHLHTYPHDVQELTISIGSSLANDKVKLVHHPRIASGINREVFESQQEWHLYKHVETKSRTVRGYLSTTDEDGDLDIPGKERERSVLTFSCHVARRSGYFFWNGFCIIFLLTVVGFSAFAITADETQQRLSVAYTLLLSQIAFRWTISFSQLMPAISYLTTMDKYSVLSMFTLIVLCAWHAVIGSLMFTYYRDQPVTTNTYWLWVDRYIFFALLFLYIVMHVVFFITYYRGPYRYRRKMLEKDKQYERDTFGDDKSTHDQLNHV